MFKVLVFVIAFLSCSTIAVSQTAEKKETVVSAAADAPSVEAKAEIKPEVSAPVEAEKPEQKTDFWTKMMSILGSLYVGMWAIGEILTRVSVWTENKWDNKAAAWFSQATWFLGAFAGRMGWKLPKLVIEHEADKLAQKELTSESKS